MTITLNLPDHLSLTEQEVLLPLAAHLYDIGELSLGQDLVHLSKAELMNRLGTYRVSIFGETIDDIRKDLGRINNQKDF